jgi:hypothetical protein
MRYLAVSSLLFAGLLMSSPVSVAGPAEPKLRVFVSHTGADAVGVSLVRAIRDEVGRSDMLADAVGQDDAEIVLIVSTLDPNPTKPGLMTTASWTLVYMKDATKVYVGSGLRLTDQERVVRSAEELVAYVAGLLKARRAELPGSAEWEQYAKRWNETVERVAETLPEDAGGIKARAAFHQEMRVTLRWSVAAGLMLDAEQAAKSAAADYVTDEEFVKKVQSQAAKLAQCQSDLAALKKK